MTPLIQWAERHGISAVALTDLYITLGAAAPPDRPPADTPAVSEAAVQQSRRLFTARHGLRMWRNNSGACADETGRMIRYGLGNDSEQVNRVMKSSDLIGITPVVCRCGLRYGVFTAEECKRPGWHLTPGDKRGQAQLVFGQLVISMGGIFRFITNPEEPCV